VSAARFEELFNANSKAMLGYLLRRVQVPEDAADLVAEVFATAWRRIDDVPPGEEARLWLYGVARNVLANHRRGRTRRDRLADKLRTHLARQPYAPEPSAATDAVRAALDRLSPEDREVLTLTAWEGLTSAEIGTLIGQEPATVRARLGRARERLRIVLDADLLASDAGQAPSR
jgi:RNA polymerase sigma-70 factor, ECF subfamily